MLFIVALLAFVTLGLPDGVLGVAWPSVRRTFELPLSQLGVYLAAAMGGYLASSLGSGWVVERVGVGRLLFWSSVGTAGSSVGYALAPAWSVMVLAAVVSGLGAGSIDAGINAYAATSFSARDVTWLHASYGVGAMLGPLSMTAVLATGLSWRWGYAAIGIVLVVVSLGFLATRHLWTVVSPSAAAPHAVTSAPFGETLAVTAVWLNVALFFLYTGLEVTAGQWTYSLLVEARGVEPSVAGIAASAYWGCLSAGRIAFGAAAGRFRAQTLLRLSAAGATVAALLLWFGAGSLLAFLGLAGLGLLFAPIFPLSISETPSRVGARHAHGAIGFQVAAAYLGAAAIPAGVGLLARERGLEVVPGALFVGSALLLLVLLLLSRRT